MTDDGFDRELAGRLRAYESRLPDAPTPAPGARSRGRNHLPLALGAGVAALAAVVLALVVLQGWRSDQVGDPATTPMPTGTAAVRESAHASESATPVSSPSPDVTSSPDASAAPAPSESPLPGPTDLAWSVAGSFPSRGAGPSMVEHLVAVDGGYVAAGVSYAAALPGVGPTPAHTLETWLSTDGRTWERAETGLENVAFTSLVVRPDGHLLATGRRGTVGEYGYVEDEELAIWTSAEGGRWTEVSIAMPGVPTTIVRGARGYLALLRPDPASDRFELWHSPDAATWTAVRDGAAGFIDVGAGDEGFVAVGTTAAGSDEQFATASGDGVEWFEASSLAPVYWPRIAAFGPDWITMSAMGNEDGTGSGQTWRSSNGLDWEAHGQAPMARVEVGGGTCEEIVRHLHTADYWLVAATDLAYPCSEGSFVVHGTQLISRDGATWEPLPFDAGTPGTTRSGAIVNAAAVTSQGLLPDGGLILAGEMDGVATFWFGERP